MDLDFIKKPAKPSSTKIVLLVLDGVGGLPGDTGNRTELETAHTPNLDTLAEQGTCGLHKPVDVGITPGSGPAHLSLFGYDPVKYQVGRGVLSALGIDFDYFYLHIKSTDSAGEDGDFKRKVSIIEEADKQIARLLDLVPDVLIVTGDHNTPSFIGSHSWHPVPVIVWSKSCLPDKVNSFGERACMTGGLGPQFSGVDLMPLAMANALRLEKFGA